MRMYFLVMYNLSPIQKGIQAGHAALEYVEKYSLTDEYRDFIQNHKTFILLDGGASGDMKKHIKTLQKLNVNYAEFKEPDLNNSISAIAFLAKEEDYASDGYYGPFQHFLSQFNLAR